MEMMCICILVYWLYRGKSGLDKAPLISPWLWRWCHAAAARCSVTRDIVPRNGANLFLIRARNEPSRRFQNHWVLRRPQLGSSPGWKRLRNYHKGWAAIRHYQHANQPDRPLWPLHRRPNFIVASRRFQPGDGLPPGKCVTLDWFWAFEHSKTPKWHFNSILWS